MYHALTSVASGVILTLNALMVEATLQGDAQAVLGTPLAMTDYGWKVELSREWDVLGPFPIHAREQHFLSPSFPLNLTQPIDFDATWPSAYADGGFVGWSKAQAKEDGVLEVAFPDIRWESIRATEGWAALQHHSLLRTTLTVYPPPTNAPAEATATPRLLVNLLQGSFFAVTPVGPKTTAPEWRAGNIYAMGRSPPNTVDFPIPPSLDSPTTYELFLSGDYEIRLFGDPHHADTEVPKLSVTISVDIEEPKDSLGLVERAYTHDIFCDFIDGWAFGDAFGLGVRSLEGWWTAVSIEVSGPASKDLELSVLQPTRVGPTQTRIVPIKIAQKKPIYNWLLNYSLKLRSDDGRVVSFNGATNIRIRMPWTDPKVQSSGIKASYFFGTSIPTAFLVGPPKKPSPGASYPPILALHGAGVDIFANDFWIKALPREQHSWVVAPTGRTEWGLDWHGPSAQEAWSSVEALHSILDRQDEWREWGFASQSKVLLMGHSNGGQGAWYLAARNPDRIVGVVPAAGYIKSQAYVPWVQSRSAHYVDPSVRAILDSSLTPDDNDLFLTNLVDTPIFAVHGGDDDNVPVWHTREAVSVIRTWNPNANITFREDPGQPHWYDAVFAGEEVESFVSTALQGGSPPAPSQSFTLTVAIPSDSGPLHGWSIHRLMVPGRLGRLAVTTRPGEVNVNTANVKAFSVPVGSLPHDVRYSQIHVDGQILELDEASWDQPEFTLGLSQEDGIWTPHAPSSLAEGPRTGRVANILTSTAPLIIVVPSRSASPELSGALRIAHSLDIYHKLDAEIVDDQEAAERLRDGTLGAGNVVVLGIGQLSEFAKDLLAQGSTPFTTLGGGLTLRGRPIDTPSTAALFLHPHPSHSGSLALFLHGADQEGFERALRLFPIRTGVTVPDWIVVGSRADKQGSGGVEGTGVWGNDWSWNGAMSAF